MTWQNKDVKSPQIKIHTILISVLRGFCILLVSKRDIITNEWASTDYLVKGEMNSKRGEAGSQPHTVNKTVSTG